MNIKKIKMKQYINKIVLVIVVISAPLISYGQHCNNFHAKYCSRSENDFFKLNGQSKSALFSKGQTSDLNIIVYKAQDYRLSFCLDKNLGSQVKFKIYETVKKKVEKVVETKKMQDVLDENGKPTGEKEEVVSKETSIVIEKSERISIR